MTGRPSRLAATALLFVVTAVLVAASPAAAYEPAPEDSDRLTLQASASDLTWSFSRRNIFADERVTTAIAILVDETEVIAAAGVSGRQLGYADGAISTAAEGQSVEHAELLLAASGVATSDVDPAFVQSRRCRIWTPAEAASADTDAVAGALSDALVSAFATIGIAIEPCDAASTAADADIFLSTADMVVEDPSFLGTDADSFLEFRGGQPTAGTGGDPVPGNAGPAPAQGGNAGLHSGTKRSADLQLAAAAIAFGLLLFGGRWLSGDRPRS